MAPKVEIKESCIVVPHEETPKHRLWLSNLDVFAARNHTPTFYLYKNNGDPNFVSVEILKNALSKVLTTFYPLAGRLVFDGEGRLEVDCNPQGVLFSVAHADCTIAGFGDFLPSPALRQLLVPSFNEPERSCFLALFQFTFFECGGVCLGSAIYHSIADGISALHFLKSWSEIARGLDIISVPPVFDHTLLRARSPPTVSFDHIEYANDQLYTKLITPDDVGQECETTILTISKDQVNALKHGFNGERNLSTFKAVAVHLWRAVCKARELTDEQYTRLYVTVAVRARLKPPLPMGYFGNGMLRTSSHLRVGDLVSKPFESGVSSLEESIKRVDDEYIRSLVDLLEIHKSDKRQVLGSRSPKMTDFFVNSWLTLPLYEADFGWGKLSFMARASMRYVGQAYIMRGGPGNSEAVLVATSFEAANMARLKEIFYRDLDSEAV